MTSLKSVIEYRPWRLGSLWRSGVRVTTGSLKGLAITAVVAGIGWFGFVGDVVTHTGGLWEGLTSTLRAWGWRWEGILPTWGGYGSYGAWQNFMFNVSERFIDPLSAKLASVYSIGPAALSFLKKIIEWSIKMGGNILSDAAGLTADFLVNYFVPGLVPLLNLIPRRGKGAALLVALVAFGYGIPFFGPTFNLLVYAIKLGWQFSLPTLRALLAAIRRPLFDSPSLEDVLRVAMNHHPLAHRPAANIPVAANIWEPQMRSTTAVRHIVGREFNWSFLWLMRTTQSGGGAGDEPQSARGFRALSRAIPFVQVTMERVIYRAGGAPEPNPTDSFTALFRQGQRVTFGSYRLGIIDLPDEETGLTLARPTLGIGLVYESTSPAAHLISVLEWAVVANPFGPQFIELRPANKEDSYAHDRREDVLQSGYIIRPKDSTVQAQFNRIENGGIKFTASKQQRMGWQLSQAKDWRGGWIWASPLMRLQHRHGFDSRHPYHLEAVAVQLALCKDMEGCHWWLKPSSSSSSPVGIFRYAERRRIPPSWWRFGEDPIAQRELGFAQGVASFARSCPADEPEVMAVKLHLDAIADRVPLADFLLFLIDLSHVFETALVIILEGTLGTNHDTITQTLTWFHDTYLRGRDVVAPANPLVEQRRRLQYATRDITPPAQQQQQQQAAPQAELPNLPRLYESATKSWALRPKVDDPAASVLVYHAGQWRLPVQ
jgi:hypothetical protein